MPHLMYVAQQSMHPRPPLASDRCLRHAPSKLCRFCIVAGLACRPSKGLGLLRHLATSWRATSCPRRAARRQAPVPHTLGALAPMPPPPLLCGLDACPGKPVSGILFPLQTLNCRRPTLARVVPSSAAGYPLASLISSQQLHGSCPRAAGSCCLQPPQEALPPGASHGRSIRPDPASHKCGKTSAPCT
jgi:hypothetical protein